MTEMLWPEAVQFGEVVYPPGSTLRPRVQRNVQLVLVHGGEMTVWIDGKAHLVAADTMFVLLPGHEERFAFARQGETWHTWLHAYLPDLSLRIVTRFTALPWPLGLSPGMTELMR